MILDFQSSVLKQTIADRAIERTVAERREEYVREIQRVLDATYRVIARTGEVDPSLRQILDEAKLSTQGFYRYFESKDELLLLLLDDGRRRLVGYLAHRMAATKARDAKARAWIEGVLAQASRADARTRTLPFFANEDRLAAAFPDEQQASVDALLELLVNAGVEHHDAKAIYDVAFGALHAALRLGAPVPAGEAEHLVMFCLRAIDTRGKR